MAKRTAPPEVDETEPETEERSELLQWFDGKKPHTETAVLYGNPTAAKAIGDAQAAVSIAEMMLTQKPDDEERQQGVANLRAKLAEVEKEHADQVKTFVFRSISGRELEKLELLHPPTKEQVSEARRRSRDSGLPPQLPDLDLERYCPALVARCSLSPKITPDDANKIWGHEMLSAGEREMLFKAALNAQKGPGASR